MGPDAHIWQIYLDEAEQYDETLIDGWNKTIDIILIFVSVLILDFLHSLLH
jgi:hypothetical protein